MSGNPKSSFKVLSPEMSGTTMLEKYHMLPSDEAIFQYFTTPIRSQSLEAGMGERWNW